MIEKLLKTILNKGLRDIRNHTEFYANITEETKCRQSVIKKGAPTVLSLHLCGLRTFGA